MTTFPWLGRSVIVALGLTVVQALAGPLLAPVGPAGPSLLPWVLASNLLLALLLVRLAGRSPARGGRLFGFLLAVAFGIPALYLVEAVFFDIGIPAAAFPWLYLQALVVAAGAAVLSVWAAGKLRGEGEALRPVPLSPVRLGLTALAYVFFYFAAGLLAWPFLKCFYEGRAMPAVQQVALLQVFRGAAFGLLVWLIAKHEPEGRRPAALSAGLCLSIIGGVAPLLIPGNPYLPDAVRQVHLVEVGISNFLFGLVAALLLR